MLLFYTLVPRTFGNADDIFLCVLFFPGTANHAFVSQMPYHSNSNQQYLERWQYLEHHWGAKPQQNLRFRNFSEPVPTNRARQQQPNQRRYSKPRSLLGVPPQAFNASTSTSSKIGKLVDSREDYPQRKAAKRRHHSDVTPGFNKKEESKKLRRNSGEEQTARSLNFSPFQRESPVYTVGTVSLAITLYSNKL